MNKRTFLKPQPWSVFVLLFCGGATSADYANINSVRQGDFLFNSDTPNKYKVVSTNTRVLVDVTGPMARTKVRQLFSNPSDQWMTGTYAFPLPEDATVDHMKILVAGRIIEGVICKKDQVRKVDKKEKSEGKRTSLVEQLGPNLFITFMANMILAGIIDFEIEYQELRRLDHGKSVQPWTWADHGSVTQLKRPKAESELIVLSGDSSSSLVFARGWDARCKTR